MRTDVKLGVVISMIVVFVAGGYFIFKGDEAKPIDLAQNGSNPAAGEPARPVTAPASADANRRSTGHAMNAPNRGNRQAQTARPAAPQGQPNPATDTPTSVDNSRGPSDSAALPANPPTNPSAPANSVTQPVTNLAGASNVGEQNPQPVTQPTPQNASSPIPGPSSAAEALAAMRKAAPTDPKPATNPATAAVDIHRAQPGDTLATLAQKYYGNAKYAAVLRQANPEVTDPSSLRVGTAIRIPPLPTDAASLVDAAPTKTTGSPPAPPTGAGKKATASRTYVVRPGDSFYRIAEQQLGKASRWKELLALNKALVDGDPTRLKVGQKVTLPES
jgi:LysM repeat protein